MTVLIIVYIWLVIGLVFFFIYDRSEMAKPVPYGGMPAIASLGTLRFVAGIVLTAVGFPLLASAITVGVYTVIKSRIKLYRAVHRLDKRIDRLKREHPELGDMWDRAKRELRRRGQY